MSDNHVTDVGKIGVNEFIDAAGNAYADDHAGEEKVAFNIEDHKTYDEAIIEIKVDFNNDIEIYIDLSQLQDINGILLREADAIALAKHFKLTPDDLKG